MEKKEGGETLDAKIRGGNTELNIGSQEFVCICKMRRVTGVFIFSG